MFRCQLLAQQNFVGKSLSSFVSLEKSQINIEKVIVIDIIYFFKYLCSIGQQKWHNRPFGLLWLKANITTSNLFYLEAKSIKQPKLCCVMFELLVSFFIFNDFLGVFLGISWTNDCYWWLLNICLFQEKNCYKIK